MALTSELLSALLYFGKRYRGSTIISSNTRMIRSASAAIVKSTQWRRVHDESDQIVSKLSPNNSFPSFVECPVFKMLNITLSLTSGYILVRALIFSVYNIIAHPVNMRTD